MSNLQDEKAIADSVRVNNKAREISFDVTDITIGGIEYSVWDMWKHEEYAVTDSKFSAEVNPHGARLFRIKVK